MYSGSGWLRTTTSCTVSQTLLHAVRPWLCRCQSHQCAFNPELRPCQRVMNTDWVLGITFIDSVILHQAEVNLGGNISIISDLWKASVWNWSSLSRSEIPAPRRGKTDRSHGACHFIFTEDNGCTPLFVWSILDLRQPPVFSRCTHDSLLPFLDASDTLILEEFWAGEHKTPTQNLSDFSRSRF